jgi:hypothetical protein
MRLTSSDYSGEPVWDEPSETTARLQNILVDTFIDKHMNADLMPELVQNLTPTELCELEPAEDSFLELGQSSNYIPETVSKWDARDVLFNSQVSNEGAKSSLKLLASKNSAAWFELVLENAASPTATGAASAVPLEMKIEVGNGSWESSLVQPELNQDDAGAKDMVSFSLVIVWDS